MRFSLEALTVVILFRPTNGFTFFQSTRKSAATMNVGRWENDDFLDNLSGSSEDRMKANDDYYRQKQHEKEFLQRQEGRDSEVARNFMAQRRAQNVAEASEVDDQSGNDSGDDSTLQGGSRLRMMMEQAKNQKQRLLDPTSSMQNMYPNDDEDEYGDVPIVDSSAAAASSPAPAQPSGINFDELAARGRMSMGDGGPPV
eukprot:CAMPEP_0196803476 /NCGR_PEP_ID=MMETSP1362-20130617/2903_1 /TAXON_ID=163516 /ORGANISM="Leptocylindrus danicus, Strain CCMP1856" /LENGTH=198 /DNA_ID=CAMNT_0042175103 /DNA_START=61 /DNA_END=653 /DNA_ORIENTATION=-